MIVGVDVGGTFTDVVAWDGEAMTTAKVPTTVDQSEGVITGATELTAQADALVHGTTVATNALLERKGAVVLLVTDEGFEDVIEIGRQDRPSLYDPFADRPTPLVPRHRRVASIEPGSLDGVEVVAVSLLRSYEDPSGEHAVAEAVSAVATGLPVVVSSEVAPEFREFERTSTTVLNGYLLPAVGRYLGMLSDAVDAAGLGETVSVMRSSGGLMAAAEAAQLPAAILLSGPAGGAVAAAAYGDVLGMERLVSFDMGGTSTDVCRIEGGRPGISYERPVEGYACRMPSVAINTVGAGGGSVGWIDSGGSLRVGPRSAGSDPGPACYRRGGTEATVTDADVALGRIAPSAALGGRIVIDAEAAIAALGALGRPLGLDPQATALGIVDIAEHVMSRAIRTVSIEEGADPRRAWLFAFGGAGGLHAAALARGLGMAGVVVPPHGGVLSALGLLLSPPRVDKARSVLVDRAQAEILDREVLAIRTQAAASLPGATVNAICDVRYLGQSHELSVPYEVGDGWDQLAARFHAAHRERNGFARPDDPIEVTTVRAEATAEPRLSLDAIPPWQPTVPRRDGVRSVLTADGEVQAAVVPRAALRPGDEVAGPAVVEEREATTWIAPGDRAEVHETGALLVTW